MACSTTSLTLLLVVALAAYLVHSTVIEKSECPHPHTRVCTYHAVFSGTFATYTSHYTQLVVASG